MMFKPVVIVTTLLFFSSPVLASKSEAPADPEAPVEEKAEDKRAAKKKKAIKKVNQELTPEQWNAVVCQEQKRLGSRISKNRCLTVREWHHEADEKVLRAASQLGMRPRKVTFSKKTEKKPESQ
ncbi:MAG: hypothetical protein AAF438_07875 [Pseudomonadota bacterium]